MGQSTSTRRRRYHHHPTSPHPSSFPSPSYLGLSNLPPPASPRPPPPPPPPRPRPPTYLVSFGSTPYHAHQPFPARPPRPSSSSYYAANRGSGWRSSSSPSSSSYSSSSSSSVNGMNKAPSRQPASYAKHQKVTTVKNCVNLHKNSIRLEPDELNSDHHLVSFTFDSLADGSFTILYFAKEGTNCCFIPVYPDVCMDVRVPFQKGLAQKFQQPSGTGIDLGFFELNELSKPLDGCVFPLVVYAEVCPLPKDELVGQSTAAAHAQITKAVIDKNNNGSFQVKVMKQILWVDGENYELQEIFDVGNSAEAGFDDDGSEKECVICLSEPSNTAVLPCRHMCMCSECAKTLRLQSDKCPICRQPIETIMEIPNQKQGGRNAECAKA